MRIDILQQVGSAASVSRGKHTLVSELEGNDFLWEIQSVRGTEVLRKSTNTHEEDFQQIGWYRISVTNGMDVAYFEIEVT